MKSIISIFLVVYEKAATFSYPKSNPDCQIPNCVEDYDLQRKTGLRSLSTCQCKIYKIAKLSRVTFLQHIPAHRKKRDRPSSKNAPTPFKIWPLSKVYQDGSHSTDICQGSAQRIKVDNIIQLTSPKTLQKAALQLLCKLPIPTSTFWTLNHNHE